jgi:hypothetical protein
MSLFDKLKDKLAEQAVKGGTAVAKGAAKASAKAAVAIAKGAGKKLEEAIFGEEPPAPTPEEEKKRRQEEVGEMLRAAHERVTKKK